MDDRTAPAGAGTFDVAAIDLACRNLVELVTDYLEDALEPAMRAAVQRHLRACAACVEYLRQFQATIAATGRLQMEHISPAVRSNLIMAFHGLMDDGPR